MKNNKKDISAVRIDFNKLNIDFNSTPDNPMSFFQIWFDDILSLDKHQAITAILSTISIRNKPESRVVLIKEVNEKGFIFFTNYESEKGNQIKNNNSVCLLFYWHDLERQVRINGEAIKIAEEDSNNYFSKRPRLSQIAAQISKQSAVIDFNKDYQSELSHIIRKFENQDIIKPNNWGGYLVKPIEFEFWQGRSSRLHDRLKYKKEDNFWLKERLAP
tara:strand:- start:1174 stop:1824 length:651 start_codon:yes stop_codon:yes gene_type:complete